MTTPSNTFEHPNADDRIRAVHVRTSGATMERRADGTFIIRGDEPLEAYPRVIEVRHASWNNQGILGYFSEKGVSFCNIDQPLLGRAIAPTTHATAPIGYVRLHGRNYEQWFEHEAPHDRYNYLYSEGELARWKPRIEEIAQKTDVTFVIANNHFEGKAAVNGLQLKYMLTGRKVKAPETLVERYPELREISEIG